MPVARPGGAACAAHAGRRTVSPAHGKNPARDGGGALRPGQSDTLAGPADALLWQEIEAGSGNTNYLVFHCLIADSGNQRVLDLVYKVNAGTGELMNKVQDNATGYYLPDLNWVTTTDSTSQRYVYNCLQVVADDGTNNKFSIWAAVSNYGTGTNNDEMGRSDQGLGGAIVALKYRERTGDTAPWKYNAAGSGSIFARCDSARWPDGVTRSLANPRAFQVYDNSGRYILVCDNYGVYEMGPVSNAVPTVRRFLLDKAFSGVSYREIDRDSLRNETQAIHIPLYATSVQRLPNDNWLITNSYAGPASPDATLGRAFNGEVFEFDPSATDNQIKWCSPSLKFTYPDDTVNVPTDWAQNMATSYKLKQPRSAFRQF